MFKPAKTQAKSQPATTRETEKAVNSHFDQAASKVAETETGGTFADDADPDLQEAEDTIERLARDAGIDDGSE
jgi:hypothetical protein